MNNVSFVGNAGSDPDITDVNDTKVAKITMAIKDFNKGQEDTIWMTVEAWGRQAEVLKQYVKKGDEFGVVGKMRQDKWADKTTGKEQVKLKVTADRIELLRNGGKRAQAETAAPAAVAGDGMPF